MSYELAHNAIRTRFVTLWGEITPIAFDNAKFETPANNNPPDWVRLAIADSGAFQRSMGDPGNNVFRHTGIVTTQIFVKAGRGDREALQYADTAAGIFRGWEEPAVGLRFRVPPYVRQVGVDGNWYQINVLAPFERDTLL